MVFGRLAGVDDAVGVESPSESPSGTARFLPLGSRIGSLIVRGAAGGYVVRRML